jgi:hypothetical protein
MSLWRRFRALPAATQAATWIGLAAVYTVALVLILGGGSDDDGDSAAPAGAGAPQAQRQLDPEERKVAQIVEKTEIKVAEPNDVAAFRKPDVQDVRCEDDGCTVEYTTGLPGRGRIFEDQQQMIAGIFADESVNKLTLRVFRAASVGPKTPAKPTEETSPGSPILITECIRSDEKRRAQAGRQAKVPPVPAECRALPLSQGGNNANSDAPREEGDNPNASGEGGILDGG